MKLTNRDNLESILAGKKILLGISGSIAAFKACDLVRFLKDCGCSVRVVLTDAAEKFVTPLTLETLSGMPVGKNMWDDAHGTHHIDAARWADLALVAPASANTIAKLAQGFASDLLSTELLAFQGPILIAPAMNPAMFSHPAVQKNMELLRENGCIILGPDTGITACGEEGLGRMMEPETIIEQIALAFLPEPNGKKMLITLGPTRSPIDPVRYLTNRSSGLMGTSLCWAALQAGYTVNAVCGPCDTPLPITSNRFQAHRVTTASEMAHAVSELWHTSDIFISTAAVLDWDIKTTAKEKLKKEDGTPSVELTLNPDILAQVASLRKPGQFVMGFAAETKNPVENGMKKLMLKNLDAIFINDVSQQDGGFENRNNSGWWISTSEKTLHRLPSSSKAHLARTLINCIEGNAIKEFYPQIKENPYVTTH